jgi:hypothetical protein
VSNTDHQPTIRVLKAFTEQSLQTLARIPQERFKAVLYQIMNLASTSGPSVGGQHFDNLEALPAYANHREIWKHLMDPASEIYDDDNLLASQPQWEVVFHNLEQAVDQRRNNTVEAEGSDVSPGKKRNGRNSDDQVLKKLKHVNFLESVSSNVSGPSGA